MLETLVLILAIATMVLGNLVRTLFQKSTQLRSDLESRLHAIEKVEGPFERMLADAGPAPLKRALALNVQVYAKFWKDVLQLTPVQVEQIKMHVHNLKKEASDEAFDRHFFEVRVRIEEWRGGYTRFEVAYPTSPLENPKSSSRYDGNCMAIRNPAARGRATHHRNALARNERASCDASCYGWPLRICLVF